MMTPITMLGDRSQAGTYVLRIRVHTDIEVALGKGKRRRSIPFQAGDYAYVGSARASRPSAATALGKRLVRHATRRRGRQQPIRRKLLYGFKKIQLGAGELRPRKTKRLHWSVDYLLERPEAELMGVVAIRSEVELETAIADMLEADPGTGVVEKGLGASDMRGGTHLLRAPRDDPWWEDLPTRVVELIDAPLNYPADWDNSIRKTQDARPLPQRCSRCGSTEVSYGRQVENIEVRTATTRCRHGLPHAVRRRLVTTKSCYAGNTPGQPLHRPDVGDPEDARVHRESTMGVVWCAECARSAATLLRVHRFQVASSRIAYCLNCHHEDGHPDLAWLSAGADGVENQVFVVEAAGVE